MGCGGVGWVVGLVAHETLVSAQGPLVLGFRTKGLGPGLYKKASTAAVGHDHFVTALPSHNHCALNEMQQLLTSR